MTRVDVVTTVGAGMVGGQVGIQVTQAMGYPVFGIPLGALMTALVVAAIDTPQEVTPGRRIPAVLASVLLRAITGGGIATLVVKHPAFSGYGVREVGVTLLAALITLIVPWLRSKAPAIGEAAVKSAIKGISDGIKAWIPRKPE